MTFFQRLFGGRKESLARTVTTINQIGQPQSTPANYEAFARSGYGKTVMIHRCVNLIAGAARGLTFDLYDKSNPKKIKELETHPLLDLWNKPNPLQSTADLIEAFVAYYCLSGNAYMEANRGVLKNGLPLELWVARPDKMKVVPGPKGYPAAYEFSANGSTQRWNVDFTTMTSDILHWKTFHPINDWYGMSPIEAALLAMDQNLAGQRWNLALLQNSATPSGVLQVKTSDMNPRGEITDEQYKRMRKDFDENYAGIHNTGKPMIIEGGLTWSQMSLSPKDVDYSKGRELTNTDICLVFGIPPELVGLGQKTFNNYREARLSLYEETILPTMDSAMGAINRWLSPVFGEKLCLEYDKDDIEILQWKREQRYTSLGTSNFLTQNEKREAVGYEAKEGWDVFVIGNQVGEMPDDFAGGGGLGILPPDPNQDPSQDPNQDPNKPKPDPKPEAQDDANPEADAEDEKGWKSLNLVNANEKRQSWRAQNQRRKRLTSIFQRDLENDFKELVDALKKVEPHSHDAKLTEYALNRVLSDYMPQLRKTISKHIRFALEDFGGAILGEGKSLGFDRESKANLKFDQYVKNYTDTRSGEAIKTITTSTQKRIRKIVGDYTHEALTGGDSDTDLAKFIESEFEELTPGQSQRIARTETGLASNNGSLEAVKSLQIPNMFKEWVTANDGRVRDGDHGGADHTAMNGAEVPLNEKFSVPPDADMDGPGDPSAGADQVINCRCVLTYRSGN